MKKIVESAVKGGMAATPIALGYGAADNPSGGLLAMGVGLGVGAAVHLINKHSVVSEKQFGPKKSPKNFSSVQVGSKKFSGAEMDKITKWHNEIGK